MATIKQIQRRTAQGSWSAYDLGADSSNVTVTNPYSTSGTTATTSLQSFLNDAVNGNSATGKFTTEKKGMVPATGNTNTDDFYLNATGAWSKPTNTTYAVVSTAADGLAPKTSNAPEGAYLDADGSWSVPPDTTYRIFSSASQGLVPKADNKNNTYYLNATGQWTVPPNTTYAAFTPATSAANGTAGLVPSASSSVMATSNIISGNNLSRYWLNVSGWQPIPSATTAQEGFMTPAQVTDLGNLKVASNRFKTSVEKYENIATITFNGTNPPNAAGAEWVPARFVHGMGLIIEAPVPGYSTIESYTLTNAFIFGKTGGWQNITNSLITVEIKQGVLRIVFNKIGSTYGYELGENGTASLNATFQLS